MTTSEGAAGPERSAAAPPADPRALEHEIEQTREELGATVAALMAKTDVKARAAEKGRALSNRLTGKVGQARERLAGQAGHARELAASQAGHARQLGSRPDGQHARPGGGLLGASGQVGQQAAVAARTTAVPARQAAQQAAGTIRRYPAPSAAIAATVALGVVLVIRGSSR